MIVSLCVCLSVCLPVCPTTCLSDSQPAWHVCLFESSTVFLLICLSVYLFFYSPANLSAFLSVRMSLFLSVSLYLSLFVCLSICPSTLPSVCSYILLSLRHTDKMTNSMIYRWTDVDKRTDIISRHTDKMMNRHMYWLPSYGYKDRSRQIDKTHRSTYRERQIDKWTDRRM